MQLQAKKPANISEVEELKTTLDEQQQIHVAQESQIEDLNEKMSEMNSDRKEKHDDNARLSQKIETL